MSEPEDFLERWSRRKREATEADAPEAPEPRDQQLEQKQPATPVPRDEDTSPDEGVFDVEKLPSIDSIGADTDIRDFLRPEVPTDLTREALRRAWSSDPSIRDYIGPVENGWDFNDPNSILGFGTIKAEEVPRLLARVFEVLMGEKSEPPVLEKPTVQPPQKLPTATGTPDVGSSDVHAGAEPSSSDANAAQKGEPSDKIRSPS